MVGEGHHTQQGTVLKCHSIQVENHHPRRLTVCCMVLAWAAGKHDDVKDSRLALIPISKDPLFLYSRDISSMMLKQPSVSNLHSPPCSEQTQAGIDDG